MTPGRLEYLYERMSRHLATPEEKSEFKEFMSDPMNATEAGLLVDRAFSGVKDASDMAPGKRDQVLAFILEYDRKNRVTVPVYKVPVFRQPWFRWTAAASFLLIVFSSYLIFIRKSEKSISPIAKAEIKDLAPGGNKAILTLSNGSKIILDSAANGTLTQQGNTKIIKTDSGKLLYTTADKSIAEEIGLNTLQTPRGGIYSVTLPDGTTAWLNAESSITYPTRFTGNQRNVSITGEVYFEAAHDVARPFVVSVSSPNKKDDWMRVQVLGTHFNIHAYQDSENEPVQTTLLEGSVKVTANGLKHIIKPGEQATAGFNDKTISVNNRIDIDNVMAWRNGEMFLEHGNVKKLMTDISRWYDVDIEYAGNIPDGQFSGFINKNVPLSTILKGLKTYGVETKLEGKKIIVQ
jgi:ferric-dicitrate binding protein FerR (iron transport regulator)